MPSNLIWRNWHETVSQPVRRFEVLRNPDESKSTVAGYNATTRNVQQLILEAAEQDVSLRAVGGAWSFTRIAATDGILLATQRLNYRFALNPAQLDRAYPPGEMPVFLQCGISISDINKYLATRQQAVPTSGASNGQTIAGALSTGTHGGAVRFGAVPEYVVAIHLATAPDGKTVWLERQSHPVLNDATIDLFGAEPLRDDDVFNAALVSFGCFGIVLGVVIEPRSLYYLHCFRRTYELTSARWDAIQALDFPSMDLPSSSGREPYHLELLQNVLDGGQTLITTMYHEDTRPPGASAFAPDSSIGKADSATDVIGAITEQWDGASALAAKLLTKAYAPFENRAGTPGEVFKDTSTRGRGASTAVGVPLQHARQAFQIAVDAVRQANAPAFVSMRFVKASDATLGFTMHAPVTAVTELDGAYSNSTLAAQDALWRGIRAAGIPHSFHWGKFNDLDAAKLRMAYGEDRVNRWIEARRRLIRPELRRVFTNAFADRIDVAT